MRRDVSVESPADHAPVGYALALAAFAHRGQMQRALAERGLHLGQERVVFELTQTPGISQTALAARLGVEQPTVAKAVARMARQGLVRTERDERDARTTRLFLTERGAELVDAVVACWQAIEERMVDGLSDKDRAHLRRLLERCAANLTRKEADGPRA
jgi:MarR family transcriptional regulator, organic hydroperoxide resistance regulator